MTDTDKLSVLLKEYESLRTHILQRLQNRFQFFTLGGALAGFAFFKAQDLGGFQATVLFGGAILMFVSWYYLGSIVARLSVHVASIERRVNELAGEELLSWESHRVEKSILHHAYTHGMKRRANKASEDIGAGAPNPQR